MTETVQVRTIYLNQFARVREAVETANRRAARIGVPGYTLTTAPAEPEAILRDGVVIGYADQVEVTVTGTAPAYSGWTFVATLTWEEKTAVVRAVPGLDFEIGEHRPVERLCQHCNTTRDRTDTYLLRHEDGRWMQVGSSCVRDFLGVKVPLHLLGFNPYEGCDSENVGPAYPTRLSVIAVASLASAISRTYGWVSAGKASEMGLESTRNVVGRYLFGNDRGSQELRREVKVTQEDGLLAAAAIEWLDSPAAGSGDYIDNLRAAVAEDGTCSERNLGLIVSLPAAYHRWLDREKEREARPVSVHQGTVGQRLKDLALTVRTVRYLHSDWGTTTLLMMVDDAGNMFKWFASNYDAEPGDSVVLTGTVKNHEIYNGAAYTVLTRCKVQDPGILKV
jgi:hypothetical protein